MCVKDWCPQSSGDGVWAALGSLIVAFFTGLALLVRYVVVPVVRYVIAPAAVVVAVLVWRWASGASLTGKARPATFWRSAVPPARPARRFVRRIHWSYWPGYQRAIVRWVVTALMVSGVLYPAATVLSLVSVIALLLLVRFRYAIVARCRADVIRVQVTVVHRPARALTASAATPMWSASAEQVTR